MTQMSTPATQSLARPFLAAAALLLVSALALISVLAYLAQPSTAPTAAAPAAAPIEMAHRIDAIPTVQAGEVARLLPAADLTDAQLVEVSRMADLICEGITAGVPLMNMGDSLVWNQGLTDEEAHDFVRAVAQTHC